MSQSPHCSKTWGPPHSPRTARLPASLPTRGLTATCPLAWLCRSSRRRPGPLRHCHRAEVCWGRRQQQRSGRGVGGVGTDHGRASQDALARSWIGTVRRTLQRRWDQRPELRRHVNAGRKHHGQFDTDTVVRGTRLVTWGTTPRAPPGATFNGANGINDKTSLKALAERVHHQGAKRLAKIGAARIPQSSMVPAPAVGVPDRLLAPGPVWGLSLWARGPSAPGPGPTTPIPGP